MLKPLSFVHCPSQPGRQNHDFKTMQNKTPVTPLEELNSISLVYRMMTIFKVSRKQIRANASDFDNNENDLVMNYNNFKKKIVAAWKNFYSQRTYTRSALAYKRNKETKRRIA